ncbi:MAG: MCP four helix bundle domain-containing protein [Burkholderiales bacterium]|nr:MCP four helix bundle domain-containing protein [Burkholderiales bacterium]OJX04516.1 MAG: methyl-accepting chemotaxis protein [Burkholderiales bacterium 70-64]
MNFLKNLRLGMRLAAGFATVLVLMSIMIAVAIDRFDSIGKASTRIVHEDWAKVDAASIIDSRTRANARNALEATIVTDKAKTEKIWAQVDSNAKEVDLALATLDRLVRLSEGKALAARIKEGRTKFVASIDEVRRLVAGGRQDDASQLLLLDALPAIDAVQADVNELVALQKKIVDASGAGILDDIGVARKLMLAIGACGLLIGALFAWWLTRSITVPIAEAVRVARTVASGDLTSEIDVRSTDETGQLLAALKEMNRSLESIVSQVRQSSDTIAVGSGQIATGNADLSQRTEEQASNLQQTAASMEELTTTVTQNSDTARQANQLATSASEAAAKGGEVVGQVIETMNDITASSRKIADIIGVIDSIAFQTNILALNAAVEAARAGEQGRGFAVVASEVRNLAQRSAEAAKEIKSLIGESVEKVEAGSRLVDDAGRSMDDIVKQVKRVTDLIGEISSASLQQASGIGQIGDAVTQLDQVTQQNAALVEESAAASDSLKQQASRLAELVAVFKYKEAAADKAIA